MPGFSCEENPCPRRCSSSATAGPTATPKIAEQLADACDAGIERIETVEPYPEDYDETVEQGRREIDEGFEPEIEPLGRDVDAWIARVSK